MRAVKYWVIVAAAGIGSRMELPTTTPKQYLVVQGKPVIAHTLDCLLTLPLFEKIITVIHPHDQHWQHLPYAQHEKILTTQGGAERCHSVLNGLKRLQELADPLDWVLVHDAARPCLDIADVKKLITQLEQHPVGGLLGVRIRDTVKRVAKDGNITDTLDRSELWCAQSPQMFRYEVLNNALQQTLHHQQLVTDEASAIELAGLTPVMVEGQQSNLKVTSQADLPLAEFYLSGRH